MMDNFFDGYELKARVAPGLIIAIPILVDVFYAAPVLSSWSIFATSSVCSVALLYGLSHVVRALGDATEEKLWTAWDGPPSTRFMRDRDSTWSPDLKSSIRVALKKTFSWRLLTREEEHKNPGAADRAIVDAFRRVRQFLRERDAKGLWSKHNVEYGFCRNLLACRVVWLVIASCATVFAVMFGKKTGAGAFNPASAIGSLSLICAVYVGWIVLPKSLKHIADGYKAKSDDHPE